MHFLKEIPVHEMQKLRKEEEKKEEWKKERRKERENKLEYGRCLLISLVIQLNGEGQREEEPWNLGAGVSEAQVQASLITLLWCHNGPM